MSLLLEVARGAVVANLVILLALGSVWLRNYRLHRAQHTLVMLIFAAVLFVQNLLWIALYAIDARYIGWFLNADADMQLGIVGLCGLETVALLVLAWLTFR